MSSRSTPLNPASLHFAAIDFETADYGLDSACAVAVVRVGGGEIVDRAHFLIRPPRRSFAFTYLHGISWADVADAPTFGQLWPRIRESFVGADFLAAHNAPFDRAVLHTCCETARVVPPDLAFRCTVLLARAVWRLRPTTLPAVCAHLGIALRHHDALSDAEACARIVIAAAAESTPANAAMRRSQGSRGV